MKTTTKDKKRLAAILSDLESTLNKGLKASEKTEFTSHNRTFLHMISHVQTMQESLTSEKTKH